MNIIIYFILFSNILLVNSTLPGEKAESIDREQQNVRQIMQNQNEHQPQIDKQIKHMEEDHFSPYYNLLDGNNFDKIASSAAANDWEYGYGDLLGFEEEQEIDDEQQKVGHGKVQNKEEIAERDKRRRDKINQRLDRLKQLEKNKCRSLIPPNLPKELSKNLTLRGIFFRTYQCIMTMENLIIRMEDKLIEMENRSKGKGKDPTSISISIKELVLNAQQNQKILEDHPLPFMDQEFEMDNRKGEKTNNEIAAQRKAKINESMQILLSLSPKRFIIQMMMNFSKESILETVIKYMELLFNLLDPFIGHIWKLANAQKKAKGIDQNEPKIVWQKINSKKRQRNGRLIPKKNYH